MIDVCIVTYNNEETIESVLASVEATVADARVSLWDNSPNVRTLEAIDRFVQTTTLEIRVHHDSGNVGFGHACNRLAEASEEDWLMFLNPDAEIRRWPVGGLPHDPTRMVGAAVYHPNGELQQTFGPDRTIRREFTSRVLRRHPKLVLGSSAFATDFVSGAAFFVSRRRYLDCGGFDAGRYFMYYEDLDLGRRWREAGGTVEVNPAWEVSHLGGFSAKRNHAVALMRSFKSARAYHQRWSAAAWLFRSICIVEGVLKLILAVPKGRVGDTSVGTQLRYVGYLLSGRLVERQ